MKKGMKTVTLVKLKGWLQCRKPTDWKEEKKSGQYINVNKEENSGTLGKESYENGCKMDNRSSPKSHAEKSVME